MNDRLSNKPDKYDSGVYIPKNKNKVIKLNKYGGITYRSSMEKKVMIYLDNCADIIKWGAENIEIPYILTKKDLSGVIISSSQHRYYPDIYYELKMEDGSINRIVMEIKPYKQCFPPDSKFFEKKMITKKQAKNFQWELDEYNKNLCKWEFAIKYCNSKGMSFKLFTDKQIEQMFTIK